VKPACVFTNATEIQLPDTSLSALLCTSLTHPVTTRNRSGVPHKVKVHILCA